MPTANSPVRFDVLDSWRGIAALIVCIFHYEGNSHIDRLPLIENGYLFVDFFFVLSGFVMAHSYGEKIGQSISFFTFAKLRLARLYPVHVLMLAAFVGYELIQVIVIQLGANIHTAPFSEASRAPLAIISNLLFLNGMGVHDTLTWNGPSWSISTEFYTYLVFGAICLLAAKYRSAIYVGVAILGCAMLVAFSPDFMDATYDQGFFRNIYGFALGVLMYKLAGAHKSNFSTITATLHEAIVLLAIIAFVSGFANSSLAFASPVVFAVALLVFSSEKGKISHLLKSPSLLFLGKISFSLYMTHRVLQMIIFPGLAKVTERLLPIRVTSPNEQCDCNAILLGANQWQGDIILIITLGFTIGISYLVYKSVEKPSYDFARKRILDAKN